MRRRGGGTYDDRGASYVVFGGPGLSSSTPVLLSSLDGTTGFRLNGVSAGDYAGRAVSGAGDLNGDGFDDLVIGAQNADPSGTATGAAYVVYGTNFTGAVLNPGNGASNGITGSASVDRMVGGAGDDDLIGNGGADVLYGGAGNDVLSIADLSFRRLDGGNGIDTLKLAGTGLALNLTAYRNKIFGIEKIDMRDGGVNTLTLTPLDVLNLSGTSNTLIIDGDANDVVASSGWTAVGSPTGGYQTYSAGQAILLIGTDITNINIS